MKVVVILNPILVICRLPSGTTLLSITDLNNFPQESPSESPGIVCQMSPHPEPQRRGKKGFGRCSTGKKVAFVLPYEDRHPTKDSIFFHICEKCNNSLTIRISSVRSSKDWITLLWQRNAIFPNQWERNIRPLILEAVLQQQCIITLGFSQRCKTEATWKQLSLLLWSTNKTLWDQPYLVNLKMRIHPRVQERL